MVDRHQRAPIILHIGHVVDVGHRHLVAAFCDGILPHIDPCRLVCPVLLQKRLCRALYPSEHSVNCAANLCCSEEDVEAAREALCVILLNASGEALEEEIDIAADETRHPPLLLQQLHDAAEEIALAADGKREVKTDNVVPGRGEAARHTSDVSGSGTPQTRCSGQSTQPCVSREAGEKGISRMTDLQPLIPSAPKEETET